VLLASHGVRVSEEAARGPALGFGVELLRRTIFGAPSAYAGLWWSNWMQLLHHVLFKGSTEAAGRECGSRGKAVVSIKWTAA
jgi:hypothetical protein